MLLRFACSNFRSIKDQQEILFTAAKHVKEHDEVPRMAEGLAKQRVLPAVALYGANASGKSNMLKALEFMKRAALRSHVDWENGIDRKPFRLDPGCVNEPSSFEIDFLAGGGRYHYGFVCDDKIVREEWLYTAKPRRAEQLLFHRETGRPFEYRGAIQTQGNAARKAGFERDSALVLSFLMQGNGPLVADLHDFFSRKIAFSDPDRKSDDTISLMEDDGAWKKVNEFLAHADAGIADVKVERKYTHHIVLAVPGHDKSVIVQKPIFLHSNAPPGDYFYPEDESRGTLGLFSLSGPVLRALEGGGCLCVDELDSSLHTLLSRAVIRLFTDPETNPKGAQILFTTHDTHLLSTEVLRRDQVWLTEKDQSGATHVFPLSNFKTKETDDIEAGYLDGRFGAVPYLPSWRTLAREGNRGR